MQRNDVGWISLKIFKVKTNWMVYWLFMYNNWFLFGAEVTLCWKFEYFVFRRCGFLREPLYKKVYD